MVSFALFGQMRPGWINSEMRGMEFPSNVFFTGYIGGTTRSGETLETAKQRLSRDAQSELIESIRIQIVSTTDSESRSIRINQTERLTSEFTARVQTVSEAKVAAMRTETFFDRETRMIHAFAYVRITDLANYYQSQISLWLNEVEGTLNTAIQLAERGRKRQALEKSEAVIELFANVLYAQDLLTAISVAKGQRANDQILQQNRSQQLRNRLIHTIADLENSIYIFLEIVEVVDGESVDFITTRLPGILTDKDCNCNFTEFEDQADFVIRINARLVRCWNTESDVAFCTASATVSVLNTHSQRILRPNIPEVREGWTRNDRERAIEATFRTLTNTIAEQILPMIRN